LVDIAPLAQNLAAPGTADAIADARNKIIDGSLKIFEGVIETNESRTVGTAGNVLPDSEIIGGIDWYYRNVIVLH